MAEFQDAAHLKSVFGGFIAQMAASDEEQLGGSGVVIAYSATNPDARFVIDARETPQPGKRFAYYIDDANAPQPDVEFTASADSLDKLYRGEAQAMGLVFTRKLKVNGDMGKAMSLLPALDAAVPLYRAYREAKS
jgi:hypothetical protein